MNPLSLFTYYRRHKGHTALLVSLISLMTVGLYLMTALSGAIFIEPMRTNRQFLSKFNIVMPAGDEWAATVMAQVRAHSTVEHVIPIILGQGISLPEVIGGGTDWFNLFGVREEDVEIVMQNCDVSVKDGHILQPHGNSIMLSEEVAASLGLSVGDVIDDSINPEFYSNIADPLEVVAILEGDVRLGLISAEYLSNHEIYRNFPVRFLVSAQPGHEAEVEAFLRNEIQSTRTIVWTLGILNEQMAQEYGKSYLFIIPLITIVAAAVALVVGTINRMAFARRIPEFGILHAAGYSRRWLIHRLTLETAGVASCGWAFGIVLSWIALFALKLTVFTPRGHTLSVIALTPALLVWLVPLVVVGFARLGFARLLVRMDAVTIIERGELGPEAQPHQVTANVSSTRPLTAVNFYRRHKGRSFLLTGAMSLMIIAVALVIFLFAVIQDTQSASLGELKRMSSISADFGSHLDMSIISQVRTHPSVDRVIPYIQMTMLDITIPPFEQVNIHPLIVYADDMAYLVSLYNLGLKEGHLPQPNSNQIVIPEVVAQNRNLQVGDMIGNREYPAYPGAMELPTDFVISGIFDKSQNPDDENWLAFASLEFVQNHEAFPLMDSINQFLVVPKKGQKDAMDAWLEAELDPNPGVQVFTYLHAMLETRKAMRTTLLTIGLIESGVTVVAAISLAVLNIISISQRQVEFGLLHALGYFRSKLVKHAVSETAFTTGMAWIISMLVCLVGLLYLRIWIFTPLGLTFNLFNPTPWFYTLPIPITVLTVTVGVVARTLHKLDPVTIIERR